MWIVPIKKQVKWIIFIWDIAVGLVFLVFYEYINILNVIIRFYYCNTNLILLSQTTC